MADRSIASLVLALCCLIPASLYAQTGAPASGPPWPGASAPPAAAGQPAYYGPPPGSGMAAAPVAHGPMPHGPIPHGPMPHGPPPHGPVPPGHGMPLPHPDFCPPGHFGPGGIWEGGDGINYELLPDDRGLFYESPFEGFVKDVLKNSWIRTEYLIWTIQRPGDDLLGAPPILVPHPEQPFPVFVGGTEIGTARVPTLSPFSLQKNDGMRLSFGLPLTFGSLEGSVFGLRKAEERRDAPELPSPAFDPLFGVDATLVGTTTLTDGQMGGNIFLYDEAYTKTYESRLWGAEGNVYFDEYAPGHGMNYEPMIGFRYFNLREHMDQVGVFNNFRTEPDLVSTIRSTTNNNVYGPQIGLRTQWIGKFLTFGVDPKFGVGPNTYQAAVTTDQLRSPADPTMITREQRTTISPFVEVSAFIKAHITDYFSLSVGYNFIWIHNITRAGTNIRYDDFGPLPQPPGVVLERRLRDITIDGLMIGGEFRFK